MRMLLPLLLLVVSLPSAAQLRIGRASVVITPPVGMPTGGSYRKVISEGVLDDLHAKTIVLEQNGKRVALVSCDLVAISEPFIVDARRLIEQQTGLKAEDVMISATHTHSGPMMPGRGVRDEMFGGEMPVVTQYRKWLPERIAESVKLALANLTPVRVSAAIEHEHAVAFNRRFHMKNGTVAWNPGRLNPDIVRPAGPIDPDVAVVYFESPDGKPLATYVNHALHVAVVGGRRFSADYPGVIARLLANVRGQDMLTVFTIGAAGNINHVNPSKPAIASGIAEANRIGTILTGSVLKAYDGLTSVPEAVLQARRTVVNLPPYPVTPDDVAKGHDAARRFDAKPPASFKELVSGFRAIDMDRMQGRPVEAEVQVIALGNQLAWVGLPGEVFVELGMAVKHASPFPFTIVAELSGPWIGYVPDRKAYPEGNYEVESARMAEGGGEMLVEAAAAMLAEMHRNAR